MFPRWTMDTISATEYGARTVAFNAYAADSTARFLMNQASMMNNIWAGVPYAFPEDMYGGLNIWNVANQSLNQVMNGGNQYVSNFPWATPQSLWGVPSPSSSSSNTKKDDIEDAGTTANDEYNQLKDILQTYADKKLKNSKKSADKKLYDDITKAIKDSNITTYKEKAEELRKLYDACKNKIDNDFISKYVELELFGESSAPVSKYLMDVGNSNNPEYKELLKSISSDLNVAGESDHNIDTLKNADEDNIIAIISEYNDSANLAEDIKRAYNKINDPDGKSKAKSAINHLVSTLTSKAETIAEYMDTVTKSKITTLVSSMPDIDKGDDFVKKFNELYAMVRISMAKLIDSAILEEYGLVDKKFAHTAADSIKDIKKEFEKSTYKDLINPETIANDIKVEESEEYVSPAEIEENNRKLDEKDNEDKIDELTKGAGNAILKEEPDAKCGDLQVYREQFGYNNKRYFVLKDDGLFYEVEKQADGTYKIKDGENGLNASDIQAAGNKFKNRNQVNKDLNDKVKEDNYPIKKDANAKFISAGDNTTTKDVEYQIYTAKINGEPHYYILNDDAKLEEVEYSGGAYKKKTDGDIKTPVELVRDIQVAEEEANRDRINKIANPLEGHIDVLAYDGHSNHVSIGRSAHRWSGKNRNKKHFYRGIESHLNKAYEWKEDSTKSSGNNKVNQYGYTKQEWNKALDDLKQYYKKIYDSLSSVDYTEKNEKGEDTTNKYALSEWCDKAFRAARGKFRADGKTGDDAVVIKKPNNDATVVVKHQGEEVETFDKLKKHLDNSLDDYKNESGLYIGCDFDCSWKWFGIDHRNEYYFYLDSEKVFEKFKSFLPS